MVNGVLLIPQGYIVVQMKIVDIFCSQDWNMEFSNRLFQKIRHIRFVKDDHRPGQFQFDKCDSIDGR